MFTFCTETNITLAEIFQESPAMVRLVNEMDKVPAVIEVLIRTILDKPEKVGEAVTLYMQCYCEIAI